MRFCFPLAALLALAACDDEVVIDEHRRGEANEFMIAVAHPLAADAGYRILEKGGSAVDASIAAEVVLSLVEPQSSGIGGGAFMVHYDASTGQTETYDGREIAPQSATPELLLDSDGKPRKWPGVALGGRGVGVPGLLRMLSLAHEEHGILQWDELFEYAIELAEEGFEVTPRLAGLLAKDTELPTIPVAKEYFYPNGSPLEVGQTLKNPAYANVLRRVAGQGADAFYRSDIARDIAEAVSKAAHDPAKMTIADLARYEAKKRPPVCVPYRSYRVCGMGPPSSGGILVAQILGMLSHFDLAALEPFSPEAVHLLVEASRLAFADRNHYIADTDFVPVPVDGLINSAYLSARAQLIKPNSRIENARPGQPGQQAWLFSGSDPEEKGLSTTHFTVRDKFGSIVSMTASIERAFGSKHMAAGVLLNNQLTDFSFLPIKDGKPVANAAQAYKRPRSTMSPTIVYDADGKPVLAIGSPGGSRIAGYTIKVILGVLDWNMHIADAIAAPNIVSALGPVTIEQGTVAEKLKAPLESKGHKVRFRSMTSGLHGIHFKGGKLVGGADPRREGVVLGD